jgi:hypothetical protein
MEHVEGEVYNVRDLINKEMMEWILDYVVRKNILVTEDNIEAVTKFVLSRLLDEATKSNDKKKVESLTEVVKKVGYVMTSNAWYHKKRDTELGPWWKKTNIMT